ncbi:MAG: hypoxanthine phosphoribosyltransferase [Phycisphaerales bacterium]
MTQPQPDQPADQPAGRPPGRPASRTPPLAAPSLQHDIERILIPRDRIAQRVAEIAQDISHDLHTKAHAPDRAVLIPILTGAMVFTADLIRQMHLKLSLELIAVSSYPGQTTESRGASIRGAIPQQLAGKHVIIVDDILDSGQTIALVKQAIAEQNPASIRTCVLLSKPARRTVDLQPDHQGFEIPDEFVVGYGLDYDGYYRNLPDICVLKPAVFAPKSKA